MTPNREMPGGDLPPLNLPPLRPRVIPVLLLKNQLLHKPRQFKAPKYVGDPRVAVKIFNDKGADELVLLDMDATAQKREPNYSLIEEIVSESFMPVAYGGGVRSYAQAARILELGVEKVVLNTALLDLPDLSNEIARVFGAQSVVGCLDCKKGLFGGYSTYVENGRRKTGVAPEVMARRVTERGVGEIILQAIEREGLGAGYDLPLITRVADAVDTPVIALGGAGKVQHFREAAEAGATAVAAGSMFVFNGPHRAVLISYPNDEQLREGFATLSLDLVDKLPD